MLLVNKIYLIRRGHYRGGQNRNSRQSKSGFLTLERLFAVLQARPLMRVWPDEVSPSFHT